MTMTFYTNPNSRGRMVRWMLEEIGCSYETVSLDYQATSQADRWGGAALAVPALAEGDDPRARFFRDVNPMGKIPALVHNGQTIKKRPPSVRTSQTHSRKPGWPLRSRKGRRTTVGCFSPRALWYRP